MDIGDIIGKSSVHGGIVFFDPHYRACGILRMRWVDIIHHYTYMRWNVGHPQIQVKDRKSL